MNVLLGGWDNYFATPANYYLYNSGRAGAARTSSLDPYFTFIPWDYDNSFGIDYFGTEWQYTDLLDWPANTEGTAHREGYRTHLAVPLVTNLLPIRTSAPYYLDHLEYLLDTAFNPQRSPRRSAYSRWRRALAPGQPGRLPGVRHPARRAVHRTAIHQRRGVPGGYAQNELRHGNALVPGIHHYVKMRCDRARRSCNSCADATPRVHRGCDLPRCPTATTRMNPAATGRRATTAAPASTPPIAPAQPRLTIGDRTGREKRVTSRRRA